MAQRVSSCWMLRCCTRVSVFRGQRAQQLDAAGQEASIYSVCRVKRPHIFIFFWKKETSRWIAGHFESDMTTDVWWEPFTHKQPSECDRVSISPKTFKARFKAKWVNSRWQLTKNSISKKQEKKRETLVAIALTNRMGKRKPAGAGVPWCADGPSVLLSFDMYRCAAPSLSPFLFFVVIRHMIDTCGKFD